MCVCVCVCVYYLFDYHRVSALRFTCTCTSRAPRARSLLRPSCPCQMPPWRAPAAARSTRVCRLFPCNTTFWRARRSTWSSPPSAGPRPSPTLHDGWAAVRDDDGNTYYHHAESGTVQWERPPSAESASTMASETPTAVSTAASTAAVPSASTPPDAAGADASVVLVQNTAGQSVELPLLTGRPHFDDLFAAIKGARKGSNTSGTCRHRPCFFCVWSRVYMCGDVFTIESNCNVHV